MRKKNPRSNLTAIVGADDLLGHDPPPTDDLPPPPPPKNDLSILDFCKQHRISRWKYYELRRKGLGPRELSLGPGCVRITWNANRDWIKAREGPAKTTEARLLERARKDRVKATSVAGKAAVASPKHVSKRKPKAKRREASR